MQRLGLKAGDRIALNLPNIPAQLYWTEGAKRLGIVYTPVFGGFSDKTLSDRIHDAGARIVVTADGGYRNAQIVPFKTAYTDPALDDYVPVATVRATIAQRLATLDLGEADVQQVLGTVDDTLAGEVTVQRSDAMRGVGRALRDLGRTGRLNAAEAARVRTAVAEALVATPPRVDAVVVVRHTAQADLVWRPERDRWSHELTDAAAGVLLQAARAAGIRRWPTRPRCWPCPTPTSCAPSGPPAPPVPLDAEFPLFFIYTSGSTGKPKGVVHVHGGYTAGVAHTMKVAFDARPGDVVYVVADPGWITGQSYMLSATMTTRCTGVLGEGAPTFPHAGRYASMIERYGVRIFKAGVTFLKTIMADAQNVRDVQQYDLVAACAWPPSAPNPPAPAVQQFGMELMTPQYINSYWATEHGGMVWTHFYGNADFPLRADAHTYPLPWIVGDVWTEARRTTEPGGAAASQAAGAGWRGVPPCGAGREGRDRHLGARTPTWRARCGATRELPRRAVHGLRVAARLAGRRRALDRAPTGRAGAAPGPTPRATSRCATPTAASACTAAATTSSTSAATAWAPRRSRARSCATSRWTPTAPWATSSSSAHRTARRA